MDIMEVTSRVEAAARSVGGERGMTYVGYDKVNRFGARYIDATDFLFLTETGTRLRVHVNGRDCADCTDAALSELIRSRISAALSRPLPSWAALLAATTCTVLPGDADEPVLKQQFAGMVAENEGLRSDDQIGISPIAFSGRST
jgi:hypothetical protein